MENAKVKLLRIGAMWSKHVPTGHLAPYAPGDDDKVEKKDIVAATTEARVLA